MAFEFIFVFAFIFVFIFMFAFIFASHRIALHGIGHVRSTWRESSILTILLAIRKIYSRAFFYPMSKYILYFVSLLTCLDGCVDGCIDG